jgi:hypothetical protein
MMRKKCDFNMSLDGLWVDGRHDDATIGSNRQDWVLLHCVCCAGVDMLMEK